MTIRQRIGIVYEFHASHKLNLDYDSPCSNLHGHTYKLECEWEGEINPTTGMIVDFTELKNMIKNLNLDHSHLNHVVEQPTAENLVEYIVEKLNVLSEKAYGRSVELVKIKLWETKKNYAEWNK